MVSMNGLLLACDSDRVPSAAGRLLRAGHRSCDDGGASGNRSMGTPATSKSSRQDNGSGFVVSTEFQ